MMAKTYAELEVAMPHLTTVKDTHAEQVVRTRSMTMPERPIQLKVRTLFTTLPKRCIRS